EFWLVTADELRLRNEIGRMHRPGTETQVRYGHRPGLFRVINEISLCVVIGVLTDNLDRLFVGADGAVRAEPVEYRTKDFVRLNRERRIVHKACIGNIVLYSDSEMILWHRLLQAVKDCFDHC